VDLAVPCLHLYGLAIANCAGHGGRLVVVPDVPFQVTPPKSGQPRGRMMNIMMNAGTSAGGDVGGALCRNDVVEKGKHRGQGIDK